MDDQSLALIRKSFLRTIPVSEIAEKVFFEHLMIIEPELTFAFSSERLIAWRAVAELIDLMPSDGRMPRYARKLGYLCAGFGLTPKRYRSIEQALLWTVRHLTQDLLEDGTIGAWRSLFAEVEHHMKEGARRHTRAAERVRLHSGR